MKHFVFCNKERINEGVGVDRCSPNSRAGNTFSLQQITHTEEVKVWRWQHGAYAEVGNSVRYWKKLRASSPTHSQLITSHWVAGQERGGEMVMRRRRRRREKRFKVENKPS